jgi:hypothetical protein
MFELLTQILILVGLFYLIQYLLKFVDRRYFTWLGGLVIAILIVMAFLAPTNRTVSILWAILSFPLRPLGLSLVLLGYALRNGIKKADGPQVMAAFLILLICSLPLTAYLLTAQTEQRSVIEAIRRQEATNPRNVQAIVVLGDGALPSDPAYRVRTQVTARDGISVTLQARLLYAADLYRVRRNSDPQVIVSIGPQVVLQGEQESGQARAVRDLLSRNGVPERSVVIDTEGADIRTSAVAVRKLYGGDVNADCRIFAFCDNGVRELPTATRLGPKIPIILVVPAISIRRAASTFANMNFEVVPRPTDFYVFQLQQGLQLAAITDLLPSAEALAITTRVIDEYLATIYYFMRGWLADPLSV